MARTKGKSAESKESGSSDKNAGEGARVSSQHDAPASPAQGGHHYVVGIGASAGGLEALSALVSKLRPGLGMSYVVVQHLSPSYKSMLPQLLGRETSLPVVEIVHGQPPRPDTIYITPPDRNVVLKDGKLELLQSPREIMPKPSVNLLLSSLAEERREDAIGVILSGTGSDGSSGIRAIKAAGGFTFAQDPASAKYDGMPQAAIDTGCVDWIQTPDGIAEELARLSEARPVLPTTEQEELPLSALKRLLNKVRSRTKLDFSGYKESTLWRRVERRLFANRCPSLDAYLTLVEQHPDELDRLAKDILISVTSFFRDRDSFIALERALKKVLERKRPGDEIRIWVPGCATGEEAYSIAIMVHRLLGSSFDQYRLQIFATDVDMDAMLIARRGIYSYPLLSELDSAVVQRYFRPSNDRFEIVKSVRDVVIFARQDLVLDPPFLRLDLISCRNVLIYLQPNLQARILSLFHYALLPDAYLFLGKSESVAQQDLLFVAENKEARVFRRRSEGGRALLAAASSTSQQAQSESVERTSLVGRSVPPREQQILRAASGFYMPPGVVVDKQMRVLHVLGDVGSFMQIPPGKASLDLNALLVRDLKIEAQTLLRSVEQRGESAIGRQRLPLRAAGGPLIRLAVHPLDVDGTERLFLICFVPADEPADDKRKLLESGDAERSPLEDELIATREHLQTIVEELETSNEEMQALNEEVQAANEELQATNEELEAANEELQSTNEELLTINEELQVKSTDLVRTNNDLASIQDNVGLPLIVVDADLAVTRYNAAAEKLFKMHRGLIGESVERLYFPGGMQGIPALVADALKRRKVVETTISGDSSEYLLRITLIFGEADLPVGAIVSLLDQTDLLRTARLLGESEARLRDVLDRMNFLVAIKDVSGKYIYANEPYKAYFAAGPDLIGGTDSGSLVSGLSDVFRGEELVVLRRRELIEQQIRLDTRVGARWLHFVRFPLIDADNSVYALCIQAMDITDKRHADEQLRLAARVIEGAAEAVLITDPDQKIVTVNAAFTRITGYRLEDVAGKTPRLLKSGNHPPEFYRSMWEEVKAHGVWQGEIENRRKNGQVYTEWLTINVIRNDEGGVANYVAIFSDISSLREARRRLEFQASHDPLTGLPNRALLNDRMAGAINRSQRHKQRVAVIFVDLDNFKDINDTLGHDQGDVVLREVARRLRGAMRDQDTVARLGGDEFVLLLEEVRDGEIEMLVERCRSALGEPVPLEERSFSLTASIGVAVYPEDGKEVSDLLRSADAAMYRSKQAGRDTYTFSTQEIRRAPVERLAMISGLRQAYESREEIYMVFQPQYSLPDRKLIGFEALMRWSSPTLGDVPPSRFIPLAEEIGLIKALSEWQFAAVIEQIRAWRAEGLSVPPVSLNVAPQQARSVALAQSLLALLAAAGLPSDAIGVELTESALAHAPEQLALALNELRVAGIECSLDDFGTGYSSLSRLSRLPITTLKIDRSFVDGLGEGGNPNDQEIARTVIVMAHSLGMRALAEGVETESQMTALRSLGCDAVQGYLLGRPIGAFKATLLLQELGVTRRPPPAVRRQKKKSP